MVEWNTGTTFDPKVNGMGSPSVAGEGIIGQCYVALLSELMKLGFDDMAHCSSGLVLRVSRPSEFFKAMVIPVFHSQWDPNGQLQLPGPGLHTCLWEITSRDTQFSEVCTEHGLYTAPYKTPHLRMRVLAGGSCHLAGPGGLPLVMHTVLLCCNR